MAVSACGKPSSVFQGAGHTALYIGVVELIVGNDVVTKPSTGAVILDNQSTKSTSLSVALNRSFGHSRLLGLLGQFGKEWNSPGDADPLQTCVQSDSGVSQEGNP
jgi:hypothetical protein